MKKNNFAFWLLGFGSGIVTLSSMGLILAIWMSNAELKDYNIKVLEEKQTVLDESIKEDKKDNNIEDINKPHMEMNNKVQAEAIEKEEQVEVTAQEKVQSEGAKEAANDKKSGIHTVVIPPKLSAYEICKLLEEKGIIDSATDFLMYIKNSGKSGNLNSGEFELHYTTNYRQLLKLLSI